MEVKEVVITNRLSQEDTVHSFSNRKSTMPDEQHDSPQLLPDIDQRTLKLHSSMVTLAVKELKEDVDMPDNGNSRNHWADYHAASAEAVDGIQKRKASAKGKHRSYAPRTREQTVKSMVDVYAQNSVPVVLQYSFKDRPLDSRSKAPLSRASVRNSVQDDITRLEVKI